MTGAATPRSPQRGTGPHALRRARRGVVYVVILVVCIGLLIGVFVYNMSMRQGRMAAYRSLEGLYAASLARSGAGLAQAALGQAALDPASPIRTKLLEPLERLTAAAGPIVLGEIDLETRYPDLVEELMRELPGGMLSLDSLTAKLTLFPNQLYPLPELPLGARKLARGGAEKCGRLFVECTATIASGGILGKVSRSVRTFQEFRVVHAPVPVLSDFTLFLRDVPAATGGDERSPANAVEAAHLGILEPSSPAVPLILDNGKRDIQNIIGRQIDLPFLKGQGWVFLGGNNVTLNLSYSQDESQGNNRAVGEDFHFYQQAPGDFEAGRAVVDPDLSVKSNEHLGGSSFWQMRVWDMGVHSLKDGPLKDQYERIFEKTPAGRRLGSSLKLYGVAPDRVSPTVVFGRVMAGFLRIAAVVPSDPDQTDYDGFYTILRDAGAGNGFLAALYAEVAAFATRILYVFDPYLSGRYVFLDPTQVSQLLPQGSGVPEPTYKTLAAGFKTRPYNVSLLHLKAGNEAPDPKDKITQVGLPAGLLAADPGGTAPMELPASLLPAEWASLDRLDLGSLDPDAIAAALGKTCCWKAPQGMPGDRFLRARRLLINGDELDLGTSVLIQGPLVLPALSKVVRGGLIVADEIQLDGTIPASLSGPLVLVARTGGIKIPAAPVHASLIALKGALVPAGPPAVTGNLVGARLELSSLSGGTPATLKYDVKLKQKPFGAAPPATPSDGLVIDFSRRYVRVD